MISACVTSSFIKKWETLVTLCCPEWSNEMPAMPDFEVLGVTLGQDEEFNTGDSVLNAKHFD